MLEDRLIQRHRDLLLGLEANRCLHLLRVLDRGRAQGPRDHPLVADAEPYPLRKLVFGEERLQRLGKAVRAGNLSVLEDARGERPHRRRLELDGSVDVNLGSRDAAGLYVEADQVAALLAADAQLLGERRKVHRWGALTRVALESAETQSNFCPATDFR